MSSTGPGSAWRSRIRAAANSFVYPLPPSNMSTATSRKRRYYIYPREDSGVYLPSGPAEIASNPSDCATSHDCPQTPSNPFEDPQYEYCVTVSERRQMRKRPDVLEDQLSDLSASVVKWKYGKALRARMRAVLKSTKKTTSEQQPREAGSTLLRGQGAHFGRSTMRRPQCTDCQRETEARSLVA